jgi:hypothetical protein
MQHMRALSIRQPYAEQILRGHKTIEYRGRPTNIRERVYIYASMTPDDIQDWETVKLRPGDLPIGILVGTVEISNCTGRPGAYQWHLTKSDRLKRYLKPKNHPQPVWFYPF